MSISTYSINFISASGVNLTAPYISIRATGSPGWNDFDFNFQAIIEIDAGDGREKFVTPAYIMPIDYERNKRLGGWIASIQGHEIKHGIAEDIRYVSLFDGNNFYKKLMQWSSSLAERYLILDKLNDIVFMSNSGRYKNEITKNIKTSEGFMFGVLRSPSTYRALRRGWRSIHAQEVESLNDARIQFEFSAQLDGFDKGLHSLIVEYVDNSIFSDRIHALIGINGTGKTRVLRELAITLGNRFPRNEPESIFLGDDATEAIDLPAYSGPNFNRVTVLSTSSENRFPIATRDDATFEYLYFNLLAHSNSEDLKYYGRSTTAGILVDIIRDTDEFIAKNNRPETKFDILVRALSDHIDLNYLYLPIIDGRNILGSFEDASGKRWIRPLDLINLGEQRKLEATALIDEASELGFFKLEPERKIRELYLSSGQNIYFTFALRLISSIDQGTLVIIDEPETHLHPNLISDFMSLLYEVLDATSSVAFIATHSVYVVREVPTHCVHLFSFEDDSRRVSIGKVRLKTLGANVHSISMAVFGDSTVRKYHDKIATEIAGDESDLNSIIEKYSSFMSPEMLIQIRSEMESEKRVME